jgi:hypothetical protein
LHGDCLRALSARASFEREPRPITPHSRRSGDSGSGPQKYWRRRLSATGLMQKRIHGLR